jgi:hypothetical protein
MYMSIMYIYTYLCVHVHGGRGKKEMHHELRGRRWYVHASCEREREGGRERERVTFKFSPTNKWAFLYKEPFLHHRLPPTLVVGH